MTQLLEEYLEHIQEEHLQEFIVGITIGLWSLGKHIKRYTKDCTRKCIKSNKIGYRAKCYAECRVKSIDSSISKLTQKQSDCKKQKNKKTCEANAKKALKKLKKALSNSKKRVTTASKKQKAKIAKKKARLKNRKKK